MVQRVRTEQGSEQSTPDVKHGKREVVELDPFHDSETINVC
jgi:hypothetical protein